MPTSVSGSLGGNKVMEAVRRLSCSRFFAHGGNCRIKSYRSTIIDSH